MFTDRLISIAAIEAIIDLAKSQPILLQKSNRAALTGLFSECETDGQFTLLKTLISNFNYLTSSDLQSGADRIVSQISSVWNLDATTTLIVASADSDDSDGSQVLCKSLAPALTRAKLKHTIKSRLGFAFQANSEEHSSFTKIVVIDDFIGTGDKLSKTVKRLQGYLPNTVEIYVASLAAMRFGLERISAETGIEVFSCHTYERGISDSFPEPQRSEFVSEMLGLERNIIPPMTYPKKQDEKCYSFGYGQSEALFFLEGFSVPNNVFPIFWKNRYCNMKAYMPFSGRRKRRSTDEREALLTRA
jgi:uncharacterized protein (DUF2164 family)